MRSGSAWPATARAAGSPRSPRRRRTRSSSSSWASAWSTRPPRRTGRRRSTLLRKKGFGEADLAEAEELIKAGHEVIRSRFDGGWERVGELKARFKGEPWVEALDDGTAGSLMKYPAWAMRIAGPRMMPRGLDRLLVPRLAARPGKAGHPHALADRRGRHRGPERGHHGHDPKQLAARGKPFELVVYPGADHGIVLFEEKDGERVYTGYAPGYFPKKVEWIRRQAGLSGS